MRQNLRTRFLLSPCCSTSLHKTLLSPFPHAHVRLFCFLLPTIHCALLHFLGALYFHTTNKTAAGFTWKRTENPVFKWTRIRLFGPFCGQNELSCHPRCGQMKLTFEKWEDTAVDHKHAVFLHTTPRQPPSATTRSHCPRFAPHRLESSLFQVTYFLSFP